MCADEVAEEVRSGEFGGGVETFEDQFMVLELGGFEESMVKDSDDEGVEKVRSEGYGEELEGAESREHGHEDLGELVISKCLDGYTNLVGQSPNPSGFGHHLVDI